MPCFLNISKDSNSTTSLGSLFQFLITLSEKNFFQIPNLKIDDCVGSFGRFVCKFITIQGTAEVNTQKTGNPIELTYCFWSTGTLVKAEEFSEWSRMWAETKTYICTYRVKKKTSWHFFSFLFLFPQYPLSEKWVASGQKGEACLWDAYGFPLYGYKVLPLEGNNIIQNLLSSMKIGVD